MLRVVLDVNVLVSGLLDRPGPPAQTLRAWYAGEFELVVSPLLLEELADVLERPHIERHASARDAATVLERLRSTAVMVADPPLAERLVPGDPDDDYLVALARAGRAQVIVSGDTDVLEADTEPPAYAPREFLARLAEIP